MIAVPRQEQPGSAFLLPSCGFCRFLWELETNFAVFYFQIGGERASAIGDETVEEIRLARANKILRLLFWNVAIENRFAQSEFARAFGLLRMFTTIAFFRFKYVA